MNGVRGLEKCEKERERVRETMDPRMCCCDWCLLRLPILNGVRGLKICPNKQCKKVWKCEKEREADERQRMCCCDQLWQDCQAPHSLQWFPQQLLNHNLSHRHSITFRTLQYFHLLFNHSINISVILWQFFFANRQVKICCMKVMEKKCGWKVASYLSVGHCGWFL